MCTDSASAVREAAVCLASFALCPRALFTTAHSKRLIQNSGMLYPQNMTEFTHELLKTTTDPSFLLLQQRRLV